MGFLPHDPERGNKIRQAILRTALGVLILASLLFAFLLVLNWR